MNKIGERDDFVATPLMALWFPRNVGESLPRFFSGERAAAHRLVRNMNHKNHLTSN